jgi:monothiol glutaredoxin
LGIPAPKNAKRQPLLPFAGYSIALHCHWQCGARGAEGEDFLRHKEYNRLPKLLPLVASKMEIIDSIKEQIESNPVILYMKGSPNEPQCGFSARTSQALMACGERFAYVDILSNPDVRANLPAYANWPTFPQLWVQGELIGGCDIVVEMYENGELQPLVKEAALPADAAEQE